MAGEEHDGVSSPQFFTKSQVALDDDFEGLRTLTKTSLPIIPKNGHLLSSPVVIASFMCNKKEEFPS